MIIFVADLLNNQIIQALHAPLRAYPVKRMVKNKMKLRLLLKENRREEKSNFLHSA